VRVHWHWQFEVGPAFEPGQAFTQQHSVITTNRSSFDFQYKPSSLTEVRFTQGSLVDSA
jgi:hypothetical protein